jgi:hypothetical protein
MLVSKAVDRGFIGGGLAFFHDTTDEPTIYCFQQKNVNHYATNEPTIYPFKDKYANHCATDEPTIYRSRDKNANPPR